jgi:membrane peptidoglycan carboxypeptidase
VSASIPSRRSPRRQRRTRLIDYPRRGRQGIRRWVPSWKLVTGVFLTSFAGMIAALAVAYAATPIPDANSLTSAQNTIVYYSDGKTEIGRIGPQNRSIVPLSRVSLAARTAVLAAENRDFYSDPGVSLSGTARALLANLRGGELQGGSTITQQYVKNVYLTQERTYTRKLKEVLISVKVGKERSKNQILEGYLNTIYFGRGAYGIEAAAQTYFGVSAARISSNQAAVLAALIQQPSNLDPANSAAARKQLITRWNYVLDGMVPLGLDPIARAKAVFPPILPRRPPNSRAGQVGYLLQYVQQELRSRGFSDADLELGGYRIITTLNAGNQTAVVRAVEAAGPKERTVGLRVGVASIEPGTGAVLALYGGEDYLKRQENNATQTQVRAGSTFKAFATAAFLREGYSLSSRFDGSNDQRFPTLSQPVPNEDNTSYGQVTVRYALQESINTAFVNLDQQIGPDKVYEAAVAAGVPENTVDLKINGAVPMDVALGNAAPSPLVMASSYATFAAGGARATPYVVQEIRLASGKIRYRAKINREQSFDAGIAADVSDALTGVVKQGTGQKALRLGRPVAGKTGTTDDNRSAWFVGYTPRVATAVAMFRTGPKGEELSLRGVGGLRRVNGASFPTEIWTEYMSAVSANSPVENFPPPVGGGKVLNGYVQPTSSPTPSVPSSSPVPKPSRTPRPTPSPSGLPLPTVTPSSGQPKPRPSRTISLPPKPAAR